MQAGLQSQFTRNIRELGAHKLKERDTFRIVNSEEILQRQLRTSNNASWWFVKKKNTRCERSRLTVGDQSEKKSERGMVHHIRMNWRKDGGVGPRRETGCPSARCTHALMHVASANL